MANMTLYAPPGVSYAIGANGVRYNVVAGSISIPEGAIGGLLNAGWSIMPRSAATAGGQVSDVVRDGSGNITSYTENGIAYTMTYNADGTVHTISGGGVVKALQYDGNGQFSGAVVS